MRKATVRHAWAAALAALPVWAGDLRAQPSGELLYLQHCVVCHQPDGQGVPGLIPPLAGNSLVTAEDPDQVQVFLSRVIFGYHGSLMVDGRLYAGRMPPVGQRGHITDRALLELINYQRTAWGNAARPVTAAELERARAAARR